MTASAVYEGWVRHRRHSPVEHGFTYRHSMMLLDLDEPTRVRGVSGAVFAPEAEFETSGFVSDVVFPTGIVEQGDTVLIYYGAADTYTAVTEFRMRDLLAAVGC